MPTLDERYLNVIKTLSTSLEYRSVVWALTGSTSFALQGVPLTPNDVDIQTTEDGAYAIEEAFSGRVVEPVSFSESETIRSHFGVVEINGIRVEIMGAVQKRQPDGKWEPPVNVTDHRTFVDVDGISIPVLTLQYEASAYEQLGRSKRATVLSKHAEN